VLARGGSRGFGSSPLFRALPVVVFAVAGFAACVCAFIVLVGLHEQLAPYSVLPRWQLILYDHGSRVLEVWHAERYMGERDGVALTAETQRGVLRYYLLPRREYLAPQPPPSTPGEVPGYVAEHREFFERKGVQWLIWEDPRPKDDPRRQKFPDLYDVGKVLRSESGARRGLRGIVGPERPTHVTDYLAVCAVIAVIVALGWGVHGLLAGRGGTGSWLEALPRAFALGLVGLYAVVSWPLLLGAKLRGGWVVAAGLAAAIVAVAARLVLRRRAERTEAKPRERFSALRAGAVALCVALFLAAVALAALMPVRNVDALNHWGFAAKAYHYGVGVWDPLYLDPDRGYVYGRYPVLVPVTLATTYAAMGSVEDQAAKLLFPAFYGAILLAICGAMRHERGGTGSTVVVCVLAASGIYFQFEGGAISALADVPVSLFFLLGLIEWQRWATTGDGHHLALWVLLLSGGAATKMEGQVLLVLALLGAAMVGVRGRRLSPWRVIVCMAGPAMVVLPWYWFTHLLPPVGGFLPSGGAPFRCLGRNLPALPYTINALGTEAVNAEHWGMLWPLAFVAFRMCWVRSLRKYRPILVMALCQMSAYVAAYLLTPYGMRALVDTTKARLLTHLAPIAAYLAWVTLPALPLGLTYPEGHGLASQNSTSAKSTEIRQARSLL